MGICFTMMGGELEVDVYSSSRMDSAMECIFYRQRDVSYSSSYARI